MNAPIDHADRILNFDVARNVRDLGGLPTVDGRRTRRGVVYRADGLARLNEADVNRLETLGIRTVIDLRYDEERERAPDRLPAARPPRQRYRGFKPEGSMELFAAINRGVADAAMAHTMMCSNYRRMPFEHADVLAAALRDLLEPGGAPHLIHCTSGKDRTGVVVAMVLRALAVPAEVVVADYELSNIEHQPVDVFRPDADAAAVAVVMAARGDYLRATLEGIDERCGSFAAYAESHLGLGATERAALAALLLE